MQRTDEFTLPSLWENISPPDTRLVPVAADLQQYMQELLQAPLAIDFTSADAPGDGCVRRRCGGRWP
jgi:hypothetical protein